MTSKEFIKIVTLIPLVCSCSSEVSEKVKFLNNKGCVLYTYIDRIAKEEYGFNDNVDFVSVDSFETIPETNKPYEFLYIDCGKYESSLNAKTSTQIYNWLTDYSYKRCAIFWENEDSFFFKESPLEELFGLYRGSDSEGFLINNFYFNELQIRNAGTSAVKGFDNVIFCMYRLVLDYVRYL